MGNALGRNYSIQLQLQCNGHAFGSENRATLRSAGQRRALCLELSKFANSRRANNLPTSATNDPHGQQLRNEFNMQSIPKIETERLTLSAIHPNQADSVFEIYSDPRVTEHSEIDTFADLRQASALINKFTYWFQHDQGVRWGVYLKSTQQLIGVCCFDTYLVKFHSVNLGYDFASAHWGNGYATEAVSKIVEYAFESGLGFKINRISAMTHLENQASEQVLTKIGFAKEGHLRKFGFWDNRYHDMNLFSRLRDD